ncbi:glycosyltransferase family 87 protein [Aliiroseovarius sp. KMU-50]|uniref:Glycosyltransferase family 87 protein n=1 Tax=Aliiroseovarius salicola TaxID=3009082 RepID=A0ABT4VW95_9RHOB|nr:glycosyltransferase family 87 protein [Aliiroseovarius sp. KMU-50]MDA5092516.1 glycosyltransferase family 87 protein [Aliiroseovarius sp. KMU-50]
MTGQSDRMIGTLIWAALAAQLLYRFWGAWPLDLTAVYFAAHFFQSGQMDLVYGPVDSFLWVHNPAEWEALAIAFGGHPQQIMPYVYPPLWAGLLAPLTPILEYLEFAKIILVLNVLGLVACALMIWDWTSRGLRTSQTGGPGFMLYSLIAAAGLLLTAAPQILLLYGQPHVLVTLLTVAAFWCVTREYRMLGGALLAAAAAVKMMPLLFVVLFVMDRNWRSVAGFVLTGVALALLSVAVAGWPLHQAFLTKLYHANAGLLVSQLNVTLELGLYHIRGLFLGNLDLLMASPELEPRPVWIGWAGKLTLVVGTLMIWRLPRHLPEHPRLFLRFLAMSLLLILAAPLSWSHYMILPLILLPGLIGYQPGWQSVLVNVIAIMVWSYTAFSMLAGLEQGILLSAYQIIAALSFFLGVVWMLARAKDQAVGSHIPPSPPSSAPGLLNR